jgi:hypothetical protein
LNKNGRNIFTGKKDCMITIKKVWFEKDKIFVQTYKVFKTL